MQSSYNLIKNTSALKGNEKKIATNYVSKAELLESEKNQDSREIDIKKSYESLGANILKKAKEDADEIIDKACKSKSEIEKKAYEEGYAQGKRNGYEDGYNEGLEKVRQETKDEVRGNIEKSEEILSKSNREFLEYLNKKEKDIISLAFEMASVIAKKEVSTSSGILPLLEDILSDAKGEENIIIKCNSVHIKAIEDKAEYYKKAYAIKGEIFILEDPLMEEGNAVIEKNTGKVVIGLDVALKNLEQALQINR
ncbi:flagellar biosynthesis/type III secretory pathway-like protein [Clostridium tertium]|uniref:Flagellar assembly protein H n=1 Tax=Clostridium tertium TaxID=1559 RepID=A0A6N3EJV8_9CLOT